MKRKLLLQLVAISIALVFLSCNSSSKKQSNDEKTKDTISQEKTHEKEDCSHVHWGYKGEESPENWPDLCSEFTSCGGKSQSPINIENAVEKEDLNPLEFNYSQTKTNILNNGHTLQFNITDENKLMIGEKEYKLLQYHFHALSEHTVSGSHYPIEAHFVHKHSDKDFAVVGIFYKEGAENELLAKYLEHFPREKGEYKADDIIELPNLIPAKKGYYYYTGSLTTPPCSEIVNWYVLKTPLTASKEQIEKFSEILHSNFRPVMPLNDRQIYTSSK